MADPFEPMVPGQSLESGVGPFNLDWHNAVTEVVRRQIREKQVGFSQAEYQVSDDPKVWVANVENASIAQYEAVGIRALATFPGDNTDFRNRMCFVTATLQANQPFGIAQESIGTNEQFVAKSAIASGGLQPPNSSWVRLIGTASAWSALERYLVGEQVTDGGDTFACIKPNTNVATTNATYWIELKARRGPWSSEAYAVGEVALVATVGEIVISGTSRALINVGNARHRYAGPSDLGLSSQSEVGPLEIIWKEAGTGPVWAIVRFLAGDFEPVTCTGTGAMTFGVLDIANAGLRMGGDLVTGVMTLVGTGTSTPPVRTASGAVTMAAMTLSGTGNVYFPHPGGSLYFGELAISGTGTVTNPPRGKGYHRTRPMTLSGTGTSTKPTCTGTGAMTFAVLDIDSHGLQLPDAPVTSVNGQTGDVTVEVEEADGTVAVTTTVGLTSTTYGLAARVADATHSGILSLTTQTIVGDKTFDDLLRAAYQFETNGVIFYDTDKRITFSGVTGSVTGTAIISATAGDLVPTGATYPLSVRPNYLTGNVVNLADHAFLGDIPDNIYGSVSTTNTTFGILSHSYAVYDYYNVAGAGTRWHRGVTNFDPIGNLFIEGVCVSTAGQGASAVPGSPIGVSGDMIAADAVTNAKLANAAAYSFKGNLTSGSANPTDVTLADLTAETTPTAGDYLIGMLASGQPVKIDIDDLPGGGGAGDVTAASNFGADNRLIRSDGTTKGVQASGITVDDSDNVTGVTTVNKVTITAPAMGSTLTIADGKTLTVSNTITLTATDGSTLEIGGGGTLGTAAYTAASAYDASGAAAAAQAASQPLDATLTALAGANWAANSLAVGSGTDTVAQVTFAANTFPARASSGNLVAKTITDFGLSLVDDAAASDGRTTLGGTTVGQAVFTLTNPSAITFPRFNADNSVSALSASDFRTAIGAGSGGGSVTSVDVSGGTTGLSASGGPITSSGTITLAGTLVVANGGTGRTTGTTAYALIATGTTATGAQQTLAAGETTEILVGGGASALPVWTTATGSGSPVRATSPTLVTPLLGTPTSGTLTNCTGLPEGGLSLTDITTADVSTTKHGFAPKAPNDATKYLDGSGAWSVPAGATATPNYASPSGFRLGLESAVAVSRTDQSGATLYLNIYTADYLLVPNSGATDFDVKAPGNMSLALGTLTSGKNYDVFMWNNSGTLTLLLSSAWTSDSARNDALTTLKGIQVNNATIGSMGAKRGIYLGTIRTDSTTTTIDAAYSRFVWNMYHRLQRPVYKVDSSTASWTYNSTTWRQAGADTGKKILTVSGFAFDPVELRVAIVIGDTTPVAATVGVGIDSTTTNSANVFPGPIGTYPTATAEYVGIPAAGYHAFNWLEACMGAATVTFYNFYNPATATRQAGMTGTVYA